MKQIIVIVVLLFTGLLLPAQNPYIQHFTTADGLPSNTVYPIVQDRNNFIWFGTDAGVARYDGNDFTCFSKKDGLNSNEIIVIKEDSQGRIWFFNLNGSMNYFYRNKIYNAQNAPFLDSLQSQHFFRNFFEDNDSSLYFYTFMSREIAALNVKNQVAKYTLPAKTYFVNGIKYVGLSIQNIIKSPEKGFIVWAGGAGILACHDFSEDLRQICDTVSIGSCHQLNDNKYLFQSYERPGLTRKIFFYTNGHLSPPVNPPFHNEIHLDDAIETEDGVLWIATIDKGVYCLRNNEIIKHINIAEAQGMAQDHEGNVWISSMCDGVYKISAYFNSHKHYGTEFFDNAGISAMYPYPGTGVWMTNGEQVYLLKDQRFYTLDFSLNQRKLNQLYYLRNNSLIVGTKSYFFYPIINVMPIASSGKVDYSFPPKMEPYYGFKGIAINPITDKIFAHSHSELFSINHESLLQEEIIANFSERIHNLFFNLNDELVVNAKKNYLYRDGELIPYPQLSRFDGKIITGHLRINDSIEVINVEGDSIYLMCNKWLCNLTQAMHKPIDMMVRKMAWHEPALYLATAQNIFVIEHPKNIVNHQSVDLRFIDISFGKINDILVYNDSLYVASDDGLTIIPEAGIGEMRPQLPIPYLQSVQVNGTDADLADQELRISGKNKIKFGFSCINYSAAPLIYSYQLTGLDTSWSIGTAREVVYQNLGIGDYTFRVRAQKPGTEFSTPVDFNIVVSATLWQHPLFYIGLFIVISGWVLLSFHRRSLRRRRALEMDNQLILLEQKALLTMMNPHFIFNALGSVQNHLLHNQPKDAAQYLSQFARLIRQNLNAIKTGFISIEEEIDRLKNYLELEKLRMENHFDYTISLEDDFDEEEAMIPSMIVQPFVENAVWHGISQLKNQSGRVWINFSLETDDTIKITISDNGLGKSQTNPVSIKSRDHLNLSTEVTRRRLELLGKKHKVHTSVSYHEANPGQVNPGTKVVIVVPVSYSTDPL